MPTYKVVEPVGSPGYAAPELLRVLPYDGKVDVFSLGVVSFVLLSGRCSGVNPTPLCLFRPFSVLVARACHEYFVW